MKTTPTITGHLTCPCPSWALHTDDFIESSAVLPRWLCYHLRPRAGETCREITQREAARPAYTGPRTLGAQGPVLLCPVFCASVKTILTSVLTSSIKEENTKHPLLKCCIYVLFDFSLKLVTECDDVKSCPHGWALLTFQKLYFKIQPFGEGKWESSPSPRDINYIKNQLM